jgi:hypothetical protein
VISCFQFCLNSAYNFNLRRYNKVYISADHEKSHFGMGSPGPASLGKAVQVDPIKLTLKVPGTKHLKLKIRDCL